MCNYVKHADYAYLRCTHYVFRLEGTQCAPPTRNTYSYCPLPVDRLLFYFLLSFHCSEESYGAGLGQSVIRR